jgi:hypothetical protein
MKVLNKTDALNEAITILKRKQEIELKALTEQFSKTYESLKPINLVKNTIQQVTNSSDVKSNLVDNLIGLSTGFLSKKLLFGNSTNPIKKVAGTLLQFAITNVVSKHSNPIKNMVASLLKKNDWNKNSYHEEYHENGIGI